MKAAREEPVRDVFVRALMGAPLVTWFEWHDELDSTQAHALALGERGTHEGTLVVAATQTAGRGRYGHSWASPRGGLWFTLLTAPSSTAPLERRFALSIVAALAVRAAIARSSGLETRLKWPNDVLSGRRKLAGVIASEREALVALGCGIDVNVRRADLPSELSQVATSILLETGRETSLPALMRDFMDEFSARYARWLAADDSSLRDEALGMLVREHPVRWTARKDAPPIVGTIRDLEPSGALRLDVEGRTTTVTTGDLEILWP